MAINIPKQSIPAKPKAAIIPIPSGSQAAEILQPQPVQLSTIPTDSKPLPLQFDHDICQAHLDKVSEFMDQFAGKAGMNPYMWLERFLKPLYYRMEGLHPETSTSQCPDGTDLLPEQSEQLQKEILSLPTNEEPTLANIFKRRKLQDIKKAKVMTDEQQTAQIPQGLQQP